MYRPHKLLAASHHPERTPHDAHRRFPGSAMIAARTVRRTIESTTRDFRRLVYHAASVRRAKPRLWTVKDRWRKGVASGT